MDSIFCRWTEDGGDWVCSQCGARVLKSAVPDPPFAACKTGAETNGVAFREIARAAPFRRQVQLTEGVGAELKRLLAKAGIKASPTCQCNSHAIQMNLWGPDECERQIDKIVGWLREESERRGMPFVKAAGVLLVKLAIRNTRRKAESPLPPGATTEDPIDPP
jgi:hypothetical protein